MRLPLTYSLKHKRTDAEPSTGPTTPANEDESDPLASARAPPDQIPPIKAKPGYDRAQIPHRNRRPVPPPKPTSHPAHTRRAAPPPSHRSCHPTHIRSTATKATETRHPPTGRSHSHQSHQPRIRQPTTTTRRQLLQHRATARAATNRTSHHYKQQNVSTPPHAVPNLPKTTGHRTTHPDPSRPHEQAGAPPDRSHGQRPRRRRHRYRPPEGKEGKAEEKRAAFNKLRLGSGDFERKLEREGQGIGFFLFDGKRILPSTAAIFKITIEFYQLSEI
ncbi:hypothetical protein QQ045_002266 [Rhodiola kirilowii]